MKRFSHSCAPAHAQNALAMRLGRIPTEIFAELGLRRLAWLVVVVSDTSSSGLSSPDATAMASEARRRGTARKTQ